MRRFKPKLETNCEPNIRKKILIRDGNLSQNQGTKEDNRSNKQYLYKPKDFYTLVRDQIYMNRTLGTDKNFMTSRLANNVGKKLFSYFNPTCALPSNWYLDEVLLLAMPKKDGWGGLADGPRLMENVVSR